MANPGPSNSATFNSSIASGNYTTEPVSRTLTNADSGNTLECTATIALTVPAGLQSGFGCVIIPFGTTSLTPIGGAQLNGATATVTRTAASNSFFAIVGRLSAADSYVVNGS